MGYNKQAWTPDTRLQADTISLSCYLKDVYTKLGILSYAQKKDIPLRVAPFFPNSLFVRNSPHCDVVIPKRHAGGRVRVYFKALQ